MPVKITKPQVLQANWPAPSNIHTLITTRFNEFNLATHVGDDEKRVAANREHLADLIPSLPNWLNQVHGIDVIEAIR